MFCVGCRGRLERGQGVNVPGVGMCHPSCAQQREQGFTHTVSSLGGYGQPALPASPSGGPQLWDGGAKMDLDAAKQLFIEDMQQVEKEERQKAVQGHTLQPRAALVEQPRMHALSVQQRALQEQHRFQAEQQRGLEAQRRAIEQQHRDQAEQQRALEAQRQMIAERSRIEAERQRALQAQRHAIDEQRRIQAERQHALQLEAQRRAIEDQRRIETERQRALEAQKRAVEEQLRIETERHRMLEAQRRLADEQRRIEAGRQQAIAAQRRVEEQRNAQMIKAAEEEAKLCAQRRAVDEQRRIDTQRHLALEAARSAAVEQAQIEAQRRAAEEHRRLESHRQLAFEGQRKPAEEQAHTEARRKAAEEEKTIESQRKLALEAQRQAAEEQAQIQSWGSALVEQSKLESQRQLPLEGMRIATDVEMQRRVAEKTDPPKPTETEEHSQIEAQRRPREDERKVASHQQLALEATRLEAQERARIETKRKAEEDQRRLEAQLYLPLEVPFNMEEQPQMEQKKASEEHARIETRWLAGEERRIVDEGVEAQESLAQTRQKAVPSANEHARMLRLPMSPPVQSPFPEASSGGSSPTVAPPSPRVPLIEAELQAATGKSSSTENVSNAKPKRDDQGSSTEGLDVNGFGAAMLREACQYGEETSGDEEAGANASDMTSSLREVVLTRGLVRQLLEELESDSRQDSVLERWGFGRGSAAWSRAECALRVHLNLDGKLSERWEKVSPCFE
eukprot:TRINITY_DN12006_c0_g2_i2.p1 TRINITY_DN12006_c0_g2~~TRINITY_DN12006_c0_g2_i2.p1  ORF type:complete len:736 (+),score=174.03 TRINITY_DN12006_c0_g2_i2:75-2282(+)